jgi:PAS domain S-box-containing protein
MPDYKELFNSSPLGIFIANFEGKYIDANDKALIQCGYTLEELSEIDVLKLIHPDNLEYGMKMFEHTLKEGKSTFDL